MRIESSFEVGAPPAEAWRLLNDVPAVLPCMPGAELVEVVGDAAWRAALDVKLGPIALRFLADIRREEVDDAARRVRLAVDAREAKGRGNAQAAIESSASETATGTRVDIATELTLRGAVAQHGRGLIADVASRLTTQFAACLESKLAAAPGEESVAPAPAPAQPADGLRLLLGALWRSLLRRG